MARMRQITWMKNGWGGEPLLDFLRLTFKAAIVVHLDNRGNPGSDVQDGLVSRQ